MTFPVSSFPESTTNADIADLPSKIWVTLITNSNYMPGLLTLNYSLKKSNSIYPLVAMYTDKLNDSSIDVLKRRGIPTIRIPELKPAKSPLLKEDPRFNDCWSKLYIFKMIHFDRIIELDSDMLVTQNMDELMDIPLGDNAFASTPACVCNPLGLKHYPKDWVPNNCSFTDYYRKKKLTVAPSDEFGDFKGPDAALGLKKCNSGLIVVDPSLQTYNEVISALNDCKKTSTYKFPDQDLLSDVFEDRWLCLSYVYNTLRSFRTCHTDIWELDKIKNIHYILVPKPWQVTDEEYDDESGTFHHWWDSNQERKIHETMLEIDDEFN